MALPHVYLTEERHRPRGRFVKDAPSAEGLVATWNTKEKVKTVAGALVVCLNPGIDPPDVVRISPCPTKHCWVDLKPVPHPRILETIGKNLQAQYERWQQRAKYKTVMDPTVEQVNKACASLRRAAKDERVLFHYNGHGVPKPTNNGEIWVFNSQYTQYIPLSAIDLYCWLGRPAIYVLDCPSAGTFINYVVENETQFTADTGGASSMASLGVPEEDLMKTTILMGACRHEENLDTHPDFPADIFTSCLTTPIKVALRWLLGRRLVDDGKLTPDLLDSVPGLPQERKSPLGELHWIFTAVTDSIAWDVLPATLFQKLFRQDLLVASLFRNFLLAERVMSSMGVMPVSYPRLPPTYNHHLWQTWDVAAERILLQLPEMLLHKPPREFRSTPFFSEQLDAFALSLKYGSSKKAPPQQLPVLLQILLSPVHRVRALELLLEFMELGVWAVELTLSVGVFPYVLKLLQTTAVDLQRTLINIWAKLLALDTSCQMDLCRDSGHEYFIHFLEKEGGDLELKAKAAAVLAFICHRNPTGQKVCLEAQLIPIYAKLLGSKPSDDAVDKHFELKKWVCLSIHTLCEGRTESVADAFRDHLPELLLDLLSVPDPELRAAAAAALSCFVTIDYDAAGINFFGPVLFEHVSCASSKLIYDCSPIVRLEAGFLMACFLSKPEHEEALETAMVHIQRDVEVQMNGLRRHAVPVTTTVQKVGHLFNLPSEESSPRREEIVRWTTHDAAQAQQSLFFDEHSIAESSGEATDSHRRILENLCVLAIDPISEVSELAIEALRSIRWDLEFWPRLEYAKLSKQRHSFSEPVMQGSLGSRGGSVFIMKSRSRASHESHTQGSAGKSTASGSSDLPDFQEQTQILQTRIELTSRYCQRRPYKIKRQNRQKERSSSGTATPRGHPFRI